MLRCVRTGGGEQYAPMSERNELLSRGLTEADETIARQGRRIKRLEQGGHALPIVRAENIVWVFGSARTGSSWLSRMMASPPGRSRWNEPDVGRLFGHLYEQVPHHREQEGFILADRHRGLWLGAARSLVLESAGARFPDRVEGGYVIVKEPHGSMGAPLLMEALPESRMIFLVRDPRDVVASALDSHKAGSWSANKNSDEVDDMAQNAPDRFVAERSGEYLRDIFKSKQAYENHGGRKVLIRYEDLMDDTLGKVAGIHSALELPAKEKQLARAVQKNTWENVPEESKGEGKIFRKATPGSWREDLTP